MKIPDLYIEERIVSFLTTAKLSSWEVNVNRYSVYDPGSNL